MKGAGRIAVASLVAALVSPVVGSAQDTTRVAARDSVEAEIHACDSTIAASILDSARVVVRITLRRPDGGPLPNATAGLVLQEFASRFRPPQPLRVPVFSAGPIEMRSMRSLHADQGSLREPVLNGLYQFVMRRNGSASQLQVTVPSSAGGLDSVVLAVLKRTSDEHSFPFPLADIDDDSVTLQLRLTSAYAGNDFGFDLFASYFPKVLVVDASRSGPEPEPEFPEEERKEGMYGDVRFQVVVDRNGRADLATLELLHAPTRGFAISAVKALSEMRWDAARVGSCRVPQIVHVNVRFEKEEKSEKAMERGTAQDGARPVRAP